MPKKDHLLNMIQEEISSSFSLGHGEEGAHQSSKRSGWLFLPPHACNMQCHPPVFSPFHTKGPESSFPDAYGALTQLNFNHLHLGKGRIHLKRERDPITLSNFPGGDGREQQGRLSFRITKLGDKAVGQIDRGKKKKKKATKSSRT